MDWKKDLQRSLKSGLVRHKHEILEDIGKLVAVPSMYESETVAVHMPFGKEVRKAFDCIIEVAERFSLHWEDFDGYALHVDYGEGDETLGILVHADVVPCESVEKWISDPFTLSIREGFMYGRGVNDDKSVIIGMLYIMGLLKKANYQPVNKIRLIIGGAEETTWECMDYYLKKNEPPQVSFSPDCDFPVVNCEKGMIRGKFSKKYDKPEGKSTAIHQLLRLKSQINYGYILHRLEVVIRTDDVSAIRRKAVHAAEAICEGGIVTLVYLSKANVSRNPHKGNDASYGLVQDFGECMNIDDNFHDILKQIGRWFYAKPYGEGLGIVHHHPETGDLTAALCYLVYQEEELSVGFDIRYPVGISEEHIKKSLKEEADKEGFDMDIVQKKDRLYAAPESSLVCTLLDAYEAVMGERPFPVTKGGISYSRAVPSCVGFGPSFPGDEPHSHGENECMNIEKYFKALDIYVEAVVRLSTTFP